MMELFDKRVKVFYNDGGNVTLRIGVVSNIDDEFIILENAVLIPRERIVRIEVLLS